MTESKVREGSLLFYDSYCGPAFGIVIGLDKEDGVNDVAYCIFWSSAELNRGWKNTEMTIKSISKIFELYRFKLIAN